MKQKLPVTGKIVTKLRYSYFFQKITKLLTNLQVKLQLLLSKSKEVIEKVTSYVTVTS